MLEDQADHVALVAVAGDLWGGAQAFELTEVELAFFAQEAAIQCAEIFCAKLCP